MKLPTTFDVPDAESMRELGRSLAARLQRGDLIILTGSLGAGKTTLVQGLAQGLGVRERVTSPTFVLMRSYVTDRQAELIHIDAYRLASAGEIDDLDVDIASAITAVEWGQDAAPRLADRWLTIHIEAVDTQGDRRTVTIASVETEPVQVNTTP